MNTNTTDSTVLDRSAEPRPDSAVSAAFDLLVCHVIAGHQWALTGDDGDEMPGADALLRSTHPRETP